MDDRGASIMAVIVTFGTNGARIHEGANPEDFKGQSFLVDPAFPKGVPPHQWKMVDGKIATPVHSLQAPKKRNYLKWALVASLILNAIMITLRII